MRCVWPLVCGIMIIKVPSQLVKEMNKKRLKISLVILLVVAVSVGFFVVHETHAQSLNTGLSFAQQTGLSGQDIRVTIAKIIRIILGFLGIIAVGLIMYAGFIWMNSGGNEEKVEQAKLILRNAVIGLIIILASFGIVSFILAQLTGATGGNGNNNNNNNNNGQGIGALGNGIVKSVYPEPFQRDVPRNTAIIVTFREPILASSICDSVSGSPALCTATAKIKPDSIKIFKTQVGDHTATNLTDVAVTSVDNLTFIFKPAAPAYLGSPIETTNYTVNLTQNIKKADGSGAFGINDFRWTFEVSNLLDLTSPKINSVSEGGIWPVPDDSADVVSGQSQATNATGTITINGQPIVDRAASAVPERITPPGKVLGVTVNGTNTCADGTITVSIISQGANLAGRIGYSQPGLVPTDIAIVNNAISIAPCGLSLALDPGFAAGHSWHINVLSAHQADTLTVGSKIYSFVSSGANANQINVGNTTAATAQNIADTINAIHPEVTAPSVQNSSVTIRSKVAGASGNSIELSSSNAVQIALSTMHGGSDQTTTYSIKDKQDQPKNTVIQVNFNEAVNPLTVSGSSTELANKLEVVNAEATAKAGGAACTQDSDCRSYKCSNGNCDGDQLAGSFLTSNQYKTTEFISNIKCGVNGCGENIYCLPANSHLKVQVKAASLQPCSTNADCTVTPFTTCSQGVCNDPSSNKNYPTAPSANGVVDLADNSLDGNRNDNPQGQVNTYNENQSVQDNGGKGDNYEWSFWIGDRLDLTPPTILGLSILNNQSNVNLTSAIEIIFSKLMMSSSLVTGSILIDNGVNQITHKLINLWSVAHDPIGYWVFKEDRDVAPLDGIPDRTSAFLSHGPFNDATQYQSQVGSGVKDIYQNCYKPSSGPGCSAGPGNPSCCRNANGDLIPTTNLTPDGNCP